MIKAIQMDLARQKENLEQIFFFCDLASAHGFNMLVLYLEDRIKTAAYPYVSAEESYSEDEIRKVVEYAWSKDLEVMPVVSNLGHMERFLRHEPLSRLAEIREGIGGRFHETYTGTPREICISLEESYQFTDAYIQSVAALFPSKYFHAGLDEAWDVGFCSLCKARLEQSGGLGNLLASHIIHTHNLLTSLGKTMVMWDDMFEFCPEALAQIPKDIVLCSWNYGEVYRGQKGHFNNTKQEDLFNKYNALGFSYLMATYVDVFNVESYTKYAQNYQPLGYLATVWEKSREVLLYLYPLVANAGMLWQGIEQNDPKARLEAAVRRTYNIKHEPLVRLIAVILSRKYPCDYQYFEGVAETDEKQATDYWQNCYLLSQLDSMSTPDVICHDYYVAIRQLLEKAILAYEIKKTARDLFDYKTGVFQTDMEAMSNCLCNYEEEALRQKTAQMQLWQNHRQGIVSDTLEAFYDGIIRNIRKLKDMRTNCSFGDTGRIDIGFFMPDNTVSVKTRITVYYVDDTVLTFQPAVYKYLLTDKAYYTLSFPVDCDKVISKCRLDTWGYGSIGFTYVEAFNRQGSFVPEGICLTQGKVSDSSHILTNDSRWCYLGEPQVVYGFLYTQSARTENSIMINLKKDI